MKQIEVNRMVAANVAATVEAMDIQDLLGYDGNPEASQARDEQIERAKADLVKKLYKISRPPVRQPAEHQQPSPD